MKQFALAFALGSVRNTLTGCGGGGGGTTTEDDNGTRHNRAC